MGYRLDLTNDFESAIRLAARERVEQGTAVLQEERAKVRARTAIEPAPV